MTDQNSSSHNPNIAWVKQLYYYLVLAVAILFLCIGAFTFLRANLYYFVFTEAQESSYGFENICSQPKYINDLASPQADLNQDRSKSQTPTEQAISECIVKQKNRQYQSDILNSTLTLIISGGVLGLHLKFAKMRD